MNIEALRSQLSALDPTHPSIKHSVERIQREIAMSDGPDDIPDTVYLKAAQVVVGFPQPFKSEADTGKAITLVARAIMDAEKRGEDREREACASLTKEIGEAYGEDEPRWFECCETVEMQIRARFA